MPEHTREPTVTPQGTPSSATGITSSLSCATGNKVTVAPCSGHPETSAPVTLLPTSPAESNAREEKKVSRGLSASLSSLKLQQAIRVRTLLMTNRFRVIRTLDVAVACFAERPFKAALTAAQRAMRGMVKANLLRCYRTDQFQCVYGLTQGGVAWLDEAGHEASSSVRRVSEMTNPEHRLWAQFWVLCCQARGLQAQTEQELLQSLNKDMALGQPVVQGLSLIHI